MAAHMQVKISLLADESGRIIATLRPAEVPGNRPGDVHMRPGAGQQVVHVILPEELTHLRSLVSLHRTHRVEITGRDAHLVAASNDQWRT
jgi:hypothetical protein